MQKTLTPAIVVLLIVIAILLGCHKIVDPDIGWHLAAARLIVDEHALLETDPFSYTSPEQQWVNHEYLAELALWAFYKPFGPVGLHFYTVLIALVFAVILLNLSLHQGIEEPRKSFGLILVTAGLLAVHPRFLARPDLLNILLAAIFILVIENENAKWFRWLPALQLLWVNLHGGFIIGIILAGTWAAAFLFTYIFIKKRSIRFPVEQMLLVCSIPVVSFINPYGLKGVLHPFEQISSTVFTQTIQEWISPLAALQNTGPTPHLIAYGILLATGIVSLAYRSGRTPNYRILAFPALAILSLSSVRHIPLFIPIAIATSATGFPIDQHRFKSLSPFLKALSFCFAVGLVVSIPTNSLYRAEKSMQQFGYGFSNLATAYKSSSFLADSGLKPNLLNSYDLGGMVIHQAFPSFKVFIDGRNLVYGARFYKEYLAIIKGEKNPAEACAEYGWRTAIIKHNSSESITLLPYLAGSEYWELVFLDEAAAVFSRYDMRLSARRRRTCFNQIASPWTGTRLLDVERKGNGLPFAGLNLAGFFLQTGRPDLAEKTYALLFSLYPKKMDLRYNLGTILYSLGRFEACLDLFIEAAESGYHVPDLERRIAGLLLRFGRSEEAEHWYRKAIRASGKDCYSHLGLAGILRKRNDYDESRLMTLRALESAGDNPDLLSQIGEELSLLGKRNAAFLCFKRALAESPDHEESLIGYAKILFESGQKKQALDMLREALVEHPKSTGLIHAYGSSLREEEDFEAMRRLYLSSLELLPNDGGIAYNLGLVFLKYFDQQDSAEYWLNIAKENLKPGSPSDVEASRILKKISGTTP